MRDDVRRRLDKQIARERWKRVIPILLAVVLLISTMYIFQPPVDRIVHENAELTWSVTRPDTITGRPFLQMRATLKDGREVLLQSRLRTVSPPIGSNIIVIEEKSWLGYSTFIWDR